MLGIAKMTAWIKGLPWTVRLLLLCLAVAATAPLLAMLFGANLRQAFSLRAAMPALIYSLLIGMPAGLLLPVLARRVGKPCTRLALLTALTILAITAVGCLIGARILIALGQQSGENFWSHYAVNIRIMAALALVFGMGSYMYQALVTELTEARLKFQQKALEQEHTRQLALEAKLSSLESRIHPHFLFNTLNSISALIPASPERAEEMVGRLAKLLRSSLDTARNPYIPLDAEIEMIRAYLEIEKARFGERLKYCFEIPAEAARWPVPPMAVQSLVENAVKHGIARQADGGELRVLARVKCATLRVEVCDTGPGFDLAGVPPGRGIENLVARLEALYGDSAQLEVASQDGECVVSLVLPEVN